ncbi:hypothetical protein MRB53_038301 [Persea americana]|nr:hypothetical protein MRB53_038301 [Persea americana]
MGAWSGAGSGYVPAAGLAGVLGGVKGAGNLGGAMMWDGAEGVINVQAGVGGTFVDAAKAALENRGNEEEEEMNAVQRMSLERSLDYRGWMVLGSSKQTQESDATRRSEGKEEDVMSRDQSMLTSERAYEQTRQWNEMHATRPTSHVPLVQRMREFIYSCPLIDDCAAHAMAVTYPHDSSRVATS